MNNLWLLNRIYTLPSGDLLTRADGSYEVVLSVYFFSSFFSSGGGDGNLNSGGF